MESPQPLPKQPTAKTILVIQTAFLGDIILSTPFLRALRKLYPHADIHFLTTAQGKEILETNPWQIKLHVFDKRKTEKGFFGLIAKARELRKIKPDLVFCLHRSFRSSFLSWLIGSPLLIGFKEATFSWLYSKTVSRKKNLYEAEKNLSLLQLFSEEIFSPFPELSIGNAKEIVLPQKYIVFSPSSVWATKRWPAKYFAQVSREIWKIHGISIVLVGSASNDDLKIGQEIVKLEAENSGLINLIGKTDLKSLKSVLKNAQLVVANDSAPMHMAISLGVPVVGIFGPTTKSLGFYPLAPEGKARVVELENLDCRPCGLHGHQKCPKQHFRCMLEIQPERVQQEIESILCLQPPQKQ